MSSEIDLTDATTDPSGVDFVELTPERLRAQRTGLRWTRYPAEVLPLFIAEMDFTVSPLIRDTIVDRVHASDTGYLDGPGPLAAAFSEFAQQRWGWDIPTEHVFIATDVSCGVVEPLRLRVPHGGRIALSTPAYPGFFEMLAELPAEIIQIPLSITQTHRAIPQAHARLDLRAIERQFADPRGIDAFVLCNPHNPHGLVHTPEDLTALARLAAKYNVFVVSDEIHAPLTHHGARFTPFAPIAAAAGALSVTATSASKGWNLAGLKCSVIIAADVAAHDLLSQLPPEVACRASILGLHANVTAFRDDVAWLDRAITQIEANSALLVHLIATHLPGVRCSIPEAGYLAWLDFTDTHLATTGEHADTSDTVHERILSEALVALGQGEAFGVGGAHHVRINLATPPATLREAIRRIATLFPTHTETQVQS